MRWITPGKWKTRTWPRNERDRTASVRQTGGALRRALADSFDHLVLNAPDRWIGGVHLTARRHWRYDPRLSTLTHGETPWAGA